MPEGVAAYPRWQGPLGQGPAFATIAAEEVRRVWRSFWGQVVLTLSVTYGLVGLLMARTAAQSSFGASPITLDTFFQWSGLLPWLALAVAAITGGPALLDDVRKGALELYASRGVRQRDYLLGKVMAVFGLSTLAVVGPCLLFGVGAYFVVGKLPANWWLAPVGGAVYGVVVGALVSALALGLSCVSKSSLAAALGLLGTILVADVFVGELLSLLTKTDAFRLLSPLAALSQTGSLLMGVAAPLQFPAWWGVFEVVALAALGWVAVAWKHPRLAGA